MRLVDADDFKKRLYKIAMNGGDLTYEEFYKIASVLDNQPAAYDVDKVVDRLEEYAHGSICKTHGHGCPYLTNDDVRCENCGAIGALEIVKSGGIEKLNFSGGDEMHIRTIENEYRYNKNFKRYVDRYANDRNISVREALEYKLVKSACIYYSEV